MAAIHWHQPRYRASRHNALHALSDAGNHFVMIAAHQRASQFAHSLGDFVGAGTITDDVAKIHNHIMWGSGGEGSLQSFQVAVNVADQEYAQSSPEWGL